MARKQKDLPGIEGKGVSVPRITAIDEAAEIYVKFRDKRQAATRKELDAKKDLIEFLHKYEAKIGRDQKGAINYEFDETLVSLTPTDEKLKVKTKDSDTDEQE